MLLQTAPDANADSNEFMDWCLLQFETIQLQCPCSLAAFYQQVRMHAACCKPHPCGSNTNPTNFIVIQLSREQQRSWLYRIRPSVTHEPFHPLNFPAEQLTADFSLGVVTPNQVSA
jgi:hypothetical protein